jgi:hypothetical protein
LDLELKYFQGLKIFPGGIYGNEEEEELEEMDE